MQEIGNLKTRYTSTLETLGEEPSPDSILSAPVIGFGNGAQKLHKTVMTVLRSNEARLLKRRAEELPRDDPRAEALLCGGHCPFANQFPLTISQHLRFTSGEFTTALARKVGVVMISKPRVFPSEAAQETLQKTHSRIAFPRTSQTVTIGTSRASSLT